MWEFTSEEQGKIKKRNKIIGLIYIFGILTCLVIGFLMAVTRPTLNLNKYSEVVVKGYNGYATSELTFDYDKYEKDYERLYPRTQKTFEYMSLPEIFVNVFTDSKYLNKGNANALLSRCVDGNFDKTRRISNEDTVSYIWSCSGKEALETYGFNLNYKDMSYKVSNLPEARTFDMFDGLSLGYSGISPYAYAYIEGSPTAEEAQNLYYYLDKDTGIKNGDTITIACNRDEDSLIDYCLENYDKVPATFNKRISVAGLDSYITQFSDISESALKSMNDMAQAIYEDEELRYWDSQTESLMYFNYEGYYLASRRDDTYGNVNDLYLIYRIKVHNKDSYGNQTYDEKNIYYWYVKFSDLYNSNRNTIVNLSYNDYLQENVTFYSTVSHGWYTPSWSFYGVRTLNELDKDIRENYSDSYVIISETEHKED